MAYFAPYIGASGIHMPACEGPLSDEKEAAPLRTASFQCPGQFCSGRLLLYSPAVTFSSYILQAGRRCRKAQTEPRAG